MRFHVSQHGAGKAHTIDADRVELRFAPGNVWAQARWVFTNGADEHVFAAPSVESIGGEGSSFDVGVSDGDGAAHGPFPAENVIAGHPHGALCFIFFENAVEFWEGVTVAASYGRLRFARTEFDPA